VIGPFNYAEEKSYLKILIGLFWEKSDVGGGLAAFQYFWSLKKDRRTFHFNENEPYPDLLGLLGQYDHPWEKNNEQTRIRDLSTGKNYKIPYFCRYELETSTVWFLIS
jgi:hypothetical protein